MRYPKVQDGEWVQPRTKNYYLKCCDCGLVHRLNFRRHKGKTQFQAFRVKRRKVSLGFLEDLSPTQRRTFVAVFNRGHLPPRGTR